MSNVMNPRRRRRKNLRHRRARWQSGYEHVSLDAFHELSKVINGEVAERYREWVRLGSMKFETLTYRDAEDLNPEIQSPRACSRDARGSGREYVQRRYGMMGMMSKCDCLYGRVYGPLDGHGDLGEPCSKCEAGEQERKRRLKQAKEDVERYTKK